MPADRIVITTGSSGGFLLAFLALFEPGDRVAISAPGYPAYRNILEALGCIPVPIEVDASTRFVVTAGLIEAAHARTPLAGALLMSPGNPSGTMIAPDALRDICDCCERLGIAFVSDEIYHGLTYGAPAQTALRYSPQATIVNSFSKYYCMTGWRIGWLIAPEPLMRSLERLQQSLAISVPYLSQIAAEAAFDADDELEAVRAGYAQSRAALLHALPTLGFTDIHPPDGAFLHLRRCRPLHERLARLLQADAVGSRRGDNAGPRLRPGPWKPNAPVLLCRKAGGRRRSDHASEGMVAGRITLTCGFDDAPENRCIVEPRRTIVR